MVNEDDISEGNAAFKIPAVNLVDNKGFFNERYVYVDENVEKAGFVQTHLNGCNCVGECLPNTCICIKSSTIRITKDRRIDLRNGAIDFYDKILYECSKETCKGCQGKCKWRLTPERFNLMVELYKTPLAGWAVRSRQCIEAGTFIAEFVGEVCNKTHMEARPIEYAYNLPLLTSLNRKSNIYLDPYIYGNITRFFNHSCFENLHPFRYFSHHRDKSRISLGFFASRDIIPGDPLTIDYGPDWWAEKNFCCFCDWVYCINPAPGKRQMSEEATGEEIKRQILHNHKIVMANKECEMARRKTELLEKKSEEVRKRRHSAIDEEQEEVYWKIKK